MSLLHISLLVRYPFRGIMRDLIPVVSDIGVSPNASSCQETLDSIIDMPASDVLTQDHTSIPYLIL